VAVRRQVRLKKIRKLWLQFEKQAVLKKYAAPENQLQQQVSDSSLSASVEQLDQADDEQNEMKKKLGPILLADIKKLAHKADCTNQRFEKEKIRRVVRLASRYRHIGRKFKLYYWSSRERARR